MTMTTYTTRGSVRGSCGHQHKTMAAALSCLMADQSGCRTHGGYSDRYIRVIDDAGERSMTRDEHDDCCAAEDSLSR